MRRYEFWCHDCGKRFFRVLPVAHPCSNPNCNGHYLELNGLVELAEIPEGTFGVDFWVTNRWPLTKEK
jgi:hypothetical protein